jgi:uncharacterized protein
MMSEHAALAAILREMERPVIAVSGGVDSLTLAAFVHDITAANCQMLHAVSPAVPKDATERVQRLAAERGWALRLMDAGEFADPRYLANPSNRCFFCKTNLYGMMARLTDGQLLSGMNLDDLSDWRPGLEAAKDHGVRHPFVEAEMTKTDIRALAARMGLGDVAELPASPCLSSRVETGLPIEADTLALIDRVESHIRRTHGIATVRCRVRRDGFSLEIGQDALTAMPNDARVTLQSEASAIAGQAVTLAPYRMGSAFLRTQQ